MYGEVYNSIIGPGVTIGKGAVIRNSIIMQGTVIGDGAVLEEGNHCGECGDWNRDKAGVGEEVPNKLKPKIYAFGLAVVGENAEIPANVQIGKNASDWKDSAGGLSGRYSGKRRDSG